MRKRPWLALAALTCGLGALMPMAPAQSDKARPRRAETFNERLAREGKVTPEQAARVFAAVGPAVRDELVKGNAVTVPGLGTFRVVQVAAHKDMEPGTGRVLTVPARNTVEFLAGEGLEGAANGPAAVPAETVPAFEYVPIRGRDGGQKVGGTRSEGVRTR